MPGSVDNVVELIGTSSESWEQAAATAVAEAARTHRDLRVVEQDVLVEHGEVSLLRTETILSSEHAAED